MTVIEWRRYKSLLMTATRANAHWGFAGCYLHSDQGAYRAAQPDWTTGLRLGEVYILILIPLVPAICVKM